MPGDVKRRCVSSTRTERAAATRRAVLAAVRTLFESNGFEETTMAQIAETAGVAVDTAYAVAGRKPELLLAAVDMILAGAGEPLPAEDREYVRAIGAASTAEEKIRVYATALGRVLPRIAPLIDALGHAARTNPECRAAWERINERRAANMRLFAAELRATGRARPDLDDVEIADLVWSTNSVPYYLLLRQRGWMDDRIAGLLADLWTRLLLDGTAGR